MAIRSLDKERIEKAPFHPRLFGMHAAITSEHYLAANAGADILKAGGNAVDAAVAAALVEGVVNPHQHTIGGECPILIQLNNMAMPVVINGNTAAPRRATPQEYQKRGYTDVPDAGILAAGVPAALGSYIAALKFYGTMSFSDIALAAQNLARDGFPVHNGMVNMPEFGIHDMAETFLERWPNTVDLYMPERSPPIPGTIMRNPALADCLNLLMNSESTTSGERQDKLDAVRNQFYCGDIAREIVQHSNDRNGLLELGDLESYETHIEEPVFLDFQDCRIFKCGPWNQGPAMLQSLSILKNFDLHSLGHNSTDYLHIVIEAVKLAFADREQWYGDPRHIQVPIDELLSDDYGRRRSEIIDAAIANPEILPGDPVQGSPRLPVEQRLGGNAWGHGTVHVDVIDQWGNMVSATPSGGWLRSADVVKAIGVPTGNRLMTFYLNPEHHPNLIAPGKRPRTTISPTLVHRNGKPWMVYGSMGGDQQDQWMLQFILNRLVFDMTIAQSIEAAKFSSLHFPGFFAPHDWFVNKVQIEPRAGEKTIAGLEQRGHDVEVVSDWTQGFLLAIEKNSDTGLLEAGYDPRGAKGDVFPAAACCW